MSGDRDGYSDTPVLSGSEYHVHDPDRPHPPSVTPGSVESSDPPSDARVLFGGTDVSNWEDRDGDAAEWNVIDEELEIAPSTGDILTSDPIGDCQLHLEWRVPSDVEGSGQDRANSGVFLMDRYEIQVLDCYANATYADGYAGAVYGQHPPLVNACREPGEWQSYDILWTAPRFGGDELDAPARVTLFHNGVVAQNNTSVNGPTSHRTAADYTPHASEAPLRLQDHGDRIRFKNIWYRPLYRD